MVSKIIHRIKRIFENEAKQETNPMDNILFTKDYFPEKKFIIGDFTYGKPTIKFENEDSNLIIGKYCSIAENCVFFLGGNHRTDWISTYPFNSIPTEEFKELKHIKGHPQTKGDIVIGNDVWLGYGVIILSGVKIGNGAVIAAGSVVTKDIGDYEIWGGNPAKFLKKRFTEEQITQLNKIKWWDWNDEKVKNSADKLCSTSIDEFLKSNI